MPQTSATGPTTSPRIASEVDAAIGRRIRLARSVRQISQKDLGGTLRVSFQMVDKYERGLSRLPACRLPVISERLNYPIGWFFDEAEDRRKADHQDILASAAMAPNGISLMQIVATLDRRQSDCLLHVARVISNQPCGG